MNNENPGECATRISHKKRSKNKNHNHLYSNCGGFMPVKIYAVVVLVMDVTVKHNTIFAQMNRSDEPEKSMFSVYNTIFHAFRFVFSAALFSNFIFIMMMNTCIKATRKTHTHSNGTEQHFSIFCFVLLTPSLCCIALHLTLHVSIHHWIDGILRSTCYMRNSHQQATFRIAVGDKLRFIKFTLDKKLLNVRNITTVSVALNLTCNECIWYKQWKRWDWKRKGREACGWRPREKHLNPFN